MSRFLLRTHASEPRPLPAGGAPETRSRWFPALHLGLLGIAAAGLISLVPAPAHAAVPDYQVFELPSPQTQASGNFGERLRTLGDVNGDGTRDVLISSSNYDGNDGKGGVLANSGRLYVFSGRTRVVLRTIDPPEPQANAKFGFWSANLGDVDGDGAADFVTSAPSQVVGGAKVGQVYVYSGRTGTRLRTINPPEPLGTTGMFGGDFGGNLIALGDLNGNGTGDFVATASGAFAGSGAAYAFDGKTGAFLYKVSNPSTQDSALGFGAAEIGDVNGDRVGDYQLGAPRFDEADAVDAGRSYVINGSSGAVISTLRNPEPETGDRFGQADADGISLGDVTGDGTPDIYVDSFLADERTPGQSPPLSNAGKVFLFDGATRNLIRPLRDPSPEAGRTFGASNASAGDLDRDGRPDSVVSSRGGNPGRVTVFGGLGLGSVLKVFQDPQPQAEGTLFGSSISYPGDVNGDGLPDYFVSSRAADVGAAKDVGTAYAFISQAAPAQNPASGAAPGGGGYPLPGGGSVPPKATVCRNSAGVKIIGKTNSGGRVFQGSNGDDRICGTSAGDSITGNGGRDVISGGGGNDRINGGSGSDRINGGSGKDLIAGSSGNDSISGSSGNDRINGNSGKDRINGGSGNDRLAGASGNDVISGSTGKDIISGGSGSDRLSGNSGDDRINGDSGNDRISGGSGNDRLKGSSGNDRIDGGRGRDRISGGSGRNQITQ